MKTTIMRLIIPLLILTAAAPSGLIEAKNAVSYTEDGWKHLKRGEDRMAVFSFKNAIRENRNYKKAILGLAEAYKNIGVYDESLNLFERVLKFDPSSVDALVGSGSVFTEQGKFSKALGFFQRALKISENSPEANYGIAYLYYSMGKRIWAKRKLETILRMNPYNFDALLLMAKIKSDEKRLPDAVKLVRKAIDSDSASPKGYIQMASILFRDYIATENRDSLSGALNNLNTALSIRPKGFTANRMMGDILQHEGNFSGAADFYIKALSVSRTEILLYNLGCCYDAAGNKKAALRSFLEALKMSPSDGILTSRLEQFLVDRDYKIGHPARILRSNDNFSLALKRVNQNLADEAVMYLRRTLLLNPMNRKAREELMQYYRALDYNRMYINELKELLRVYPGSDVQERLATAVVKRRKRLYQREGYSSEMVPRDVPRVLVMDFLPEKYISPHQDAGRVMAADLSFALRQFGRLEPVGERTRLAVQGLRTDGDYFAGSMQKLEKLIKDGKLPQADYLVYGNYSEHQNMISADFKLLDFKKGMIIKSFSLDESGRDNLLRICLSSARRIYEAVPYRGRILKVKENSIIVNLGLFDGIESGRRLAVYKYSDGKRIRDRIVFTVSDSDTFICEAKPVNPNDLDRVDSSDTVFPYRRKRSRVISK